MFPFRNTSIALLALAVAACASPSGRDACRNCGTVKDIQPISQTSGAGAVAGGVVGGVAGHQIGSGRGNDAATVGGAIVGAIAGNEAEKRMRDTTAYRVLVRMEDGELRRVDVRELDGLTVGSRVKIVGDRLERIGG